MLSAATLLCALASANALADEANRAVPASCGDLPPAAQVELGRYLFYDTLLSGPGYMACASCHTPARAFTDGRAVAIGVTGKRHPHKTPSQANAACYRVLGWSSPQPRSLEAQSSVPLFSRHPVEMASAGHKDEILARLRVNLAYRERFEAAFGDTGGRVDGPAIQTALGAFQRSLLSFDSPYDRHQRKDRRGAGLSPQAEHGRALFMSDRLACASCHRPPLFTDADGPDPHHNTGL